MSKRKTLVVILGPTASGKTDISIALAEKFNTHILSTDSRQVYRGMPIGTAAPDTEQLARVPHHFIATHDIQHPYSAGAYENDALETLNRLFQTQDIVFAVGGSGLYIDALCKGMDTLPSANAQLRESLNRRRADEGLQSLLAELALLDPEYYAQVDRSNPQRIIRALEVCLDCGIPYSTLRSGTQKERNFDILKIGITLPREVLYERINLRVEIMIAQGLVEEARALYPMREYNALQTVGYKELFEYFDNKTTLDEAVELIKRNSRRYAKRQQTWFRRDEETVWFTADERCAGAIENYLREFV